MENKKTKKNHRKASNNSFWLYGRHSVDSALSNPNRIKIRLLITDSDRLPENVPSSLRVEIVAKEVIDKLLPISAVHQGIALEVKPLESLNIDDIIRLTELKGKGLIVVLDGVTDPHNIGAILRSAAAFEADAVITLDKGSPVESGTMARSAAGALDIVPWIRATNLVRSLEHLKAASFWIIGMDGHAEKSLSELDIPEKAVIVMGSEGSGMRRLTFQACDFLTKLPISSRMESLNVSNATAITLYEINKKQSL